MSAGYLDLILGNVTQVHKASPENQMRFLDRELNVTTREHQASLPPIIFHIQQQNWNVSNAEDFKLAKQINGTVGIIYINDPQAVHLPRLSLKSIEAWHDPSTLPAYAQEVQNQLALLLNTRQHLLKFVPIRKQKMSAQHLFATIDQLKSEIKSFLTLESTSSEHQRVAIQSLCLLEQTARLTNEIAGTGKDFAENQWVELLKEFRSRCLTKTFDTFFPSINAYITHHEEANGSSDQTEYEKKYQILQKLEEENKRSESIYQFLMNELSRLQKYFEDKDKFNIQKITSFPTLQEYSDMSSSQIDRFDELNQSVQDLGEQYRFAKKLSLPQKEVEISPQAPDWKEVIQFSGGLDKPLNYAKRVSDWFDDPSIPLKEERFAHKSERIQKKITLFHAPPVVLEQFVGSNYCFSELREKEILHAIPAEIYIENEVFRGFFQYTVNTETGICFHCCFSENTDHFVDALFMQQVWKKSDFPTIEEAQQIEQAKPRKVNLEKKIIYFDPIFGTIGIKMPEASIYLFRKDMLRKDPAQIKV